MTKTNFLTTTIMTNQDPWLAVKLPFLTIFARKYRVTTSNEDLAPLKKSPLAAVGRQLATLPNALRAKLEWLPECLL